MILLFANFHGPHISCALWSTSDMGTTEAIHHDSVSMREKSIQSQAPIQLMTIIYYAKNKDNTDRKDHYLNANTSIHIKGCDCVWAGSWEGLQTFISHPNYSKQAASHSFMTSVIETITRKATNRHKVTTCLKVSSQGHGMAHGPFKLYNALQSKHCVFLWSWFFLHLISVLPN